MTSYSKVKKWISEINNYAIPPMNESGLSRFVVDNNLIIHIVTSPKPHINATDSVYFYVPLLQIHTLDNEVLNNILWHIANSNMPTKLPENITLSASKDSQYVWINYRSSTESMNKEIFENALELFIYMAGEQRKKLMEIAASNTNSQNNFDIQAQDFLPQNILWG